MPRLRCMYDGLSTDCESLKLGCPPWKVIWTEMTPAALRWERGQRVYHPWNRNQARRHWREWSSQRVTLCLANFFSTSRQRVIFKATSCQGYSDRRQTLLYPCMPWILIPYINRTLSGARLGDSQGNKTMALGGWLLAFQDSKSQSCECPL